MDSGPTGFKLSQQVSLILNFSELVKILCFQMQDGIVLGASNISVILDSKWMHILIRTKQLQKIINLKLFKRLEFDLTSTDRSQKLCNGDFIFGDYYSDAVDATNYVDFFARFS